MSFEEKRERLNLAEDIGRLIDQDLPQDEREEILKRVNASGDGAKLYNKMLDDNLIVQRAVGAEIPQPSFDRFLGTIDREFSERPALERKHRIWQSGVARMAAALLLVAGTFAGTNYWAQSRMDAAVTKLAAHMESERLLLAASIQDALETRISGEPVLVGQQGDWSETLTPIETYKSTSGHWCREYVRETAFGKLNLTIRGTACRDETGTWMTVFAEPVANGFAPLPSGT
ncbi:hypothetical protein E1180_07290 [Roseibium denhamense]|uniref:Surface antigen domain-containing protein n=1 Tax=Roseibium denhamense TaxID=76305 RepID=A0ABY1PCD1_9HYPH|nr:hypothetical protein [Roseibium denhamense]MTI05316.1 hypothetical protein [Roseibium denhamense]SMP30355.1 hypothetical protein SAMN06265374_3241 [Roseibium denhamense]